MDVGSVILALLVASGACETRCEAETSLDRLALTAAEEDHRTDVEATAAAAPTSVGDAARSASAAR